MGNDVKEILDNLESRAKQAIREFDPNEEIELKRIDDDIKALKVLLKVNDNNTDS